MAIRVGYKLAPISRTGGSDKDTNCAYDVYRNGNQSISAPLFIKH